MSILAWVILGGIAGWLASLILNTDQSKGIYLNIVIGIMGAIIGGLVVTITGANIFLSMIASCVGATVFIGILRAVRG